MYLSINFFSDESDDNGAEAGLEKNLAIGSTLTEQAEGMTNMLKEFKDLSMMNHKSVLRLHVLQVLSYHALSFAPSSRNSKFLSLAEQSTRNFVPFFLFKKNYPLDEINIFKRGLLTLMRMTFLTAR